jgi:hypothetical protein
MASAGTVTVDFAVEVQRANAGIISLINGLKGFGRQIELLNQTSEKRIKQVEGRFGSLEKTVRRATQAFSVAFIANLIKEAADAASLLAKTADKLGITTEALRAFQIVGQEAGVGLEQTNKLLLEAQKRLGEAASGTGEAGKFIKKLGLDISELQRLRPDQLFVTYANAISRVTEKSEQLSVAERLMGESAIESFAIIQAGGTALDEATRFTQRFSIALNRVETKQIERANVELSRLGDISKAGAQRFALGLAPFVEELSRQIQDLTGTTQVLTAAGSILGGTFVTAFEIAANAARLFKSVLLGLAGLVNQALASLNELVIRGSATLASFSNPGLLFDPKFQEDVNKAVEATTSILKSSAQANFQQAEESLRKIKSLQQIQDEIVAIMEASRTKAEQAVAAQSIASKGGALTVQDPIALTFEQQAEINNDLISETAQNQREIFSETTEFFKAELQRRNKLEEDSAKARYDTIVDAERATIEVRAQTADLTVGLLQALGAKNKAFAIAAIVLEKAIAIQRLLINNKLAAELAFASQLIPGVPASLATATAAKAAVLAQGRIQAALIAATGALQIADVTSGGGRSPVGTALNPAFVTSSQSSSSGQFGATSQNAIQVVIANNVGFDQRVMDQIIAGIREAADDRDVIIFGPGSRQAQEILGG